MRKSDILFWGLLGTLLGISFASFFAFSNIAILLFLLINATFCFCALIRKSHILILIAIIFTGFLIGLLRTQYFFSRNQLYEGSGVFDTPLVLKELRDKFENAIFNVLPPKEANLASGIILGKSSKFSPEFIEALKRSNTMHIVAVSGQNITIIAMSVLRFFEILRIPFLISWWGALISVILFTLLVGAPASAVRAGIMGIISLIGKRIGRDSPPKIAIIFAAFLMLMYRPDLLRFDLGFQLSFLAILGIFYASPIIQDWILFKKKFWGFEKIISETVGAQVLVAPWILYKFGTLSLIGLMANLLILPVIPFSMFLGFLAGILAIIWYDFALFFSPAIYLVLKWVTSVIEFFGNMNIGVLSMQKESVPIWAVSLIYFLIFATIFIYWRRKQNNE
jgi:competence protein ComEC